MILSPLRGWRCAPGIAPGDAIAPPAIPDAESFRRLPSRNLARLVAGLRDPDDRPGENHVRAAAMLDAWREEGVFVQDRPSVYLWVHETEAGRRIDLLCRLRLVDGEEGIASPPADPAATEEELRRLRALRGNLEPVPLRLADPSGALAALLADLAAGPSCTVHGPAGAGHLRVIDGKEPAHRLLLAAAGNAAEVLSAPLLAAARRYRDEVRAARRAAGRPPPADNELDSDWTLVAFGPEAAPRVPAGLVFHFFW